MREIEDLRYTPPVRGKIGTLYSGRLLWVDIILVLCFCVTPDFLLKGARQFLERILEKSINEKNRIADKRIKFVDSGTSALFLALKMAHADNVPVYLNANACQSAGAAVVRAGGIPVFLGTTANGLTNFDEIPRKTPGSPRGILLLTNTYGFLENIRKANAIAQEANLSVINDLAQANIISEQFAEVCTKSDISVLSFGAEKYTTALGGGAIIVNKSSLHKLESIINEAPRHNVGERADTVKTLLRRLKYYLTFLVVGGSVYRFLVKWNMAFELALYKDIDNVSIPSAIGVRPLNPACNIGILLRIILLRRRAMKERRVYRNLIRAIPPDILASADTGNYIPPFLVIKTPVGKRNKIATRLAAGGFQSTWNYVPLFMLEPFRSYRHNVDSRIWTTLLQIPFRYLSAKDAQAMSSIISHANREN